MHLRGSSSRNPWIEATALDMHFSRAYYSLYIARISMIVDDDDVIDDGARGNSSMSGGKLASGKVKVVVPVFLALSDQDCAKI